MGDEPESAKALVSVALARARGHGAPPGRAGELWVGGAAVLQAQLQRRNRLLPSRLSYADFRMAVFLPFNDVARLPLEGYPAVAAWNARLTALPAWAEPFEGLQAPALPPVPG